MLVVFASPLYAEELPVLWLEAGKENRVGFDKPGERWTLRHENRILASGTVRNESASFPQSTMYPTPFYQETVKSPPLNPGVRLHAKILQGDIPKYDVLLVASDPFPDKKSWCETHSIALYDPEKKTAEILRENEIPFTPLRSFAEIENVENAVIVIGHGTDFETEKGLAELLFEQSAKGASVFVAAPKGVIPLDYDPSICSLNLCSDAEYLFPFAVKRAGGANWKLEALKERLILKEKFIPPFGIEGTAKVMGVGPTILDIRFMDPKYINRPVRPLGRIIFDKEFYFSRWKSDVAERYYFKTLIETLSDKGDGK